MRPALGEVAFERIMSESSSSSKSLLDAEGNKVRYQDMIQIMENRSNKLRCDTNICITDPTSHIVVGSLYIQHGRMHIY